MNEVGRARGSLLVRDVDGEILVLDTGSNRVHQLNRTAAVVWRLLGDRQAFEGIVSALVAQFEIDEATALRDVAEAQATLHSLGLLAFDRVTW